MDFLLIDFGTTNIKTAIVNLDTGKFSHIQSHPSVSNIAAGPGQYEVSPLALQDRLLSLCSFYADQLQIRFEGIVICSEQNGFVALNKENRPITNYINWRDERSLQPLNGISTYSLLTEEWGDRFKRITGWRPGPGLPIMNVTHLARLALLETPCKIVSLPEWLSLCSNDGCEVVHDTMLHGLTFYDIQARRISEELTRSIEELTGIRCTFNEVAPTGSIGGYWHSQAGRVPIYVGIGDHHCSVLGAGNLPGETISINIGTGSQVAVIDPIVVPEDVEAKPYFDSRTLVTVTRIPGGRALASYIGFLEDICRKATGLEVDFWEMLKEIDQAAVLNQTLEFDLAIFGSAWNFRGGGRISNILEGSLTLQNYLAALLRALAQQYVEVMRLFDPVQKMSRCILSGGVARRLPILHRIISSLSGYETLPACELEESLIGLRAVALVSARRVSSCLEAQAIYIRSSQDPRL